MPLIVLFAILFPVIHSYEHILDSGSKEKIEFSEHTQLKSKFHSAEKCSICDFKFSACSTFTFTAFHFYKNSSVTQHVTFYAKKQTIFFKGSLFSLRAPPVFIK